MKLYAVFAILLLALVYSAKSAPSEYVSEVESQTVDEAFDDELAFELANNFENEEDLNALLTLIEMQQDEEARGKFSVFGKILRSIAKVFKGVGKVRKQFKTASDLDKNQRIENEEDMNAFLALIEQQQPDEEARGKFSGFAKILKSIAKFFKGVGKVRKQFKEASDLDKNQ
uniref:Oxyopinin 2 n=1 Tax=Oxyopes takobius TaxID=666126 RepID=A0A5J6SEB1_OXYTA|nr:oxyopinin 2 precursor [Oxyopes takobius]